MKIQTVLGKKNGIYPRLVRSLVNGNLIAVQTSETNGFVIQTGGSAKKLGVAIYEFDGWETLPPGTIVQLTQE